ncbi:oxidoreductase [Streptomyces longisporoflavus]|uniref:FAD-dependent monooxygenase n=1 Tax=Streptomyces longisporoflavus TaxID=28044 RepID=UPI00167CB284|nr:FAD-dependent monooxygenase [Streptomyces longisporoflavus]GGV72734.1 oxidoreductase [Streptomyces longisporoflavus]
MKKPDVLIVGAGIAGPALAYWLSRNGYRPTVVEHARQLRSGGSAIVVKGPAIPVAERMGILPQLRELATRNRSLTLLDPHGRRILQLPLTSQKNPTIEVTRADLSRVLHQSAHTGAEFLFDDTITALEQDEGGVDVTFRRSAPRRFDLVVGADGMHSAVRRLVFGPERQYARPTGLYGATVPLEPGAVEDPSQMTMLTAPDRMLVLHPSRTTPLAIFTFRAAHPAPHDRKNTALHKQTVADAYAGLRWRAPELVTAFLDHPAPFFDPLTTLRMPTWSRGRIVLLGDAAAATALLGDGSSMAMAGAHALAEQLAARPGDHTRAFTAYESRLRREVGPRQRRVGPLSRLLLPRTRTGLAIRNAAARTINRTIARTNPTTTRQTATR